MINKKRYATSATFHASMSPVLKQKILDRAEFVQGRNGDNSPNASAVVQEALECYFYVIEQFGDDWKEHLKIQSEPSYIKRLEQRILDHLSHIRITPTQEQDTVDGFKIDDSMLE